MFPAAKVRPFHLSCQTKSLPKYWHLLLKCYSFLENIKKFALHTKERTCHGRGCEFLIFQGKRSQVTCKRGIKGFENVK